MNYLNYALMLENKRFSQIDEARQNQGGLDLVLSGENNATYKNQFAQLSTAIKAAKDKKGQWSNTVIKYADGTEMIKIYWYRDSNGKFDDNSLTWDVSKTSSAPAASGSTTNTTTAAPNANAKTFTDEMFKPYVNSFVTMLDPLNPITAGDYEEHYKYLLTLVGNVGYKDDDTTKTDAIGRFLLLYSRDEGGDSLITDLPTSALSADGAKPLNNIKKLLAPYKGKDLEAEYA
jgi:hypothetical protein